MITLSNLRTEQDGEWTRLICDFAWTGDVPNPFKEKTIWFAMKNENADFFSTKVYDPFLLVPYFVAMHYGQDLKICGNVSKKLYKNLTNYIYQIFLDYSDELQPVNLEVDGFDCSEQEGNLIGASISCGVDSFTTLYDRFEKETDPEYRINSVFFFNCGSYGSFYDESSHQGYQSRYEQNKKAAAEMGLPLYQLESNIQFFQDEMGLNRVGTIAMWSCILSLQKRVGRYYYSSSCSYNELVENHRLNHNFNIDEFCGPYLMPLVQTEKLEIIFDGGQYRRTEKTKHIADWSIVQKYLNVCFGFSVNCSLCPKCLRTLFALEAAGELGKFSHVFDLGKYKKRRFYTHCKQVVDYKKDVFAKDNVDFARTQHMKLPPKLFASIYVAGFDFLKTGIRKLIREERWQRIKEKYYGK